MSSITIGMRIEQELLAAVDAEAVRQRRSRNQMLCMMLEEWVSMIGAESQLNGERRASNSKAGAIAEREGEQVLIPNLPVPPGVMIGRNTEWKPKPERPRHAASCGCLICKKGKP